MIKRFHKGLLSIAKAINIDLSSLTTKWMDIYLHRKKFRGKKDAVKFMKELNTAAERYALRQPIVFSSWTKTSEDGFPTILGKNFRSFLRSKETSKVVMALSVMRSVESLRLPISKDISSVIEPCSYDVDVVKEILDFIPKWTKRLKPLKPLKIKYHQTLKGGPNGPALKCSDLDISAVCNDELIYNSIRDIERLLDDERPMQAWKADFQPTSYVHSKLTQFPEKAGKTRTIAIIDYYSQRCLKPLHDSLMDLLSTLVSDGTYSHQNVGKYAQKHTSEKKYVFCADLTAFTDRFPAIIQKVLLFELLKDNNLSQAYWNLLAERTFKVVWSGESVRYSCGQPMGAYASWALCSLAHHLIVEYAAYRSNNLDYKQTYRLIGDDVIITERKTADDYQRLISALGVEINLGKTVKSSEASKYSGAEVAKQLYLNGKCLTPLTPGFIRDMRKPYMFNTCMEVLLDRYEFLSSETPSMLLNIFYRKTKVKQLVKLLITNPISGIIKPGNPGYDDSPWASKDLDGIEITYRKMMLNQFINQASSRVGDFSELVLPGENPWKDSSLPPPRCYVHIKSDMDNQLMDFINRLVDITMDRSAFDNLLVEFTYVPDPQTPYMARKELRCKRITSSIVSLYSYEPNDLVMLDW